MKELQQEPLLEKRFGALNEEWSGFRRSKVFMVQAPYEGTVTYLKGTSRGPAAIIEASSKLELFDDELNVETYKVGIYTTPPLGLTIESSPEECISKVHLAFKEIFALNKFPVLIGGEHTASVGAVKAAKELFKNLGVLYLDAHCDLREEYNGSKFNHACVARRIQEMCPVVEAGIRSLSREEKDFLDNSDDRVKVISVYDILESHDWKKDTLRLLSEEVYVSIDLDVLDPCVMPAVGTPEPGGLGWYEFIEFLRALAKEKKIVGFDVVELSPRENLTMADFIAAKIIYKFLGYIFYNNKK